MSGKVRGWFVTGTDTGVGKTWVAAGLLAALAARGHATAAMKPVASGCHETAQGLRSDDASRLAGAATTRAPYATVNPYAFAPAIAPHIAAAEAGVRIDLDLIRAQFDALARGAEYTVVEGVGGWRVPLDERATVSDLAAALGLPVVLVVGLRLGCISHALLTAQSIAADGQSCAGWVAVTLEPDLSRQAPIVAALRARLDAPCLGLVPHLARLEMSVVGSCLAVDRLLA